MHSFIKNHPLPHPGLCLAASLFLVLPLTAGSAPSGGGGNICQQTAAAIRRGAQREAHADFAFQVAACLNDTGDPFQECFKEALEELHDAMSLAQDQYVARLSVCDQIGGGPYDPDLDEDEFEDDVTNPYFPLIEGRSLIYAAHTDEGYERTVVTTLDLELDIDDIECVAVSDIVTINNELVEDTVDFFSQHENGDVWYMGEVAKNFEDGLLADLDGSWQAGKDEAEPGIQMLANPQVGDVYRQEFLINEAEDLALVIALGATVHVPAGTFTQCVVTEEWSPLEPGHVEHKYFAPGVGLVLAINVTSGERTELVQILP